MASIIKVNIDDPWFCLACTSVAGENQGEAIQSMGATMHMQQMTANRKSILALLVAGCCGGLFAGNNVMGPDWDEDANGGGDAGNTKGNAQVVQMGTTNIVATISGELKGAGALAGKTIGDYQDVYAVAITEAGMFTIQTTAPNGFSEFDSALFVFDSDGFPLLANRAAAQNTPGAKVTNRSSNNKFVIEEPGLIYIAISGRATQPTNGNGALSFGFTDNPTDIVGPAQPQKPTSFEGWTIADPTQKGNYVIQLFSVGPIPPGCGAQNTSPCSVVHPLPFCKDTTCCTAVCAQDPFCCEVTWDATCVELSETECSSGCGDCFADLNGDGTIGAEDLSYLLALWGGEDQCADLSGDGMVGGDDLALLLSLWGTSCLN